MGALLCILSAAGFGTMAIFGKLAYEEDVAVGDLLLFRFALAAAILLAIAHARGVLRGLSRRAALTALAMGAIGYATQSGLFFSALERMDASLLALILYTYPALVVAAAIALGRERASGRRIAGLAAASAGAALVLAGAASGQFDALGGRDGLRRRARLHDLHPRRRPGRRRDTAAGARGARVHGRDGHASRWRRVVRGGPELGFSAEGWGWIGAIALTSTVFAILTFFAGLERVGPSAAAILSVFEPVVTVALAAIVFGESLGAVQVAGGALVLLAVVVVQWPAARGGRSWRRRRRTSTAPVEGEGSGVRGAERRSVAPMGHRHRRSPPASQIHVCHEFASTRP